MAKKNDHSLVEVATRTQSPFWDLNMSESMTIFKGFFELVASCEEMAIASDHLVAIWPGRGFNKRFIPGYSWSILHSGANNELSKKNQQRLSKFEYILQNHGQFLSLQNSSTKNAEGRLLRGENWLQVQPNALHLAGIITPCGSRCH